MTDSRSLSPEEHDALASGLAFAARIAGGDPPLSAHQVQGLYDGCLAQGVIDSEAAIALGLAFGQCLVARGPFEWVRVFDEYGEETSLGVVGSAIYIHPVSMIQKRLERGEAVVIEQLCEDTVAQISDLIEDDEVASRDARLGGGAILDPPSRGAKRPWWKVW